VGVIGQRSRRLGVAELSGDVRDRRTLGEQVRCESESRNRGRPAAPSTARNVLATADGSSGVPALEGKIQGQGSPPVSSASFSVSAWSWTSAAARAPADAPNRRPA
jgi:hypothetical protein